jgi:hypothetical protein
MTEDYSVKLRRLKEGSLRPDDFSHRDHIGVAYEALLQYEFFEAVRVIADGIRALAIRVNVPEKYNATITLAFMSLIAERMGAKYYQDAEDFIHCNADLAHESVLSPCNRSHPPRFIPEAALYSGCPGSMSPKQGLAFPLLDPGSRFARPG